MARYDYDIGIIGGGAAGLTMAAGAAQLGARTILLEKERELGGDCLHYGCVPSKTLIASAAVCHAIRHAERYGLPPVEPGPVDFAKVAGRIRQVIGTIQHHDSVERFNKLGVEVCFGRGAFADDHVFSLEGRRISSARWLIATGSSPSVPAIPGLAEAGFLTNREIFSLPRLPESLAILGGGAIALEMAQAFCRLGSRVTVLQRSDQVLSREDREVAGLVTASLADEGVVFQLGCTVQGVSREGDDRVVRFLDRDGQVQELRAAQILVALGRRVNVEGFGLEHAGVDFSAKGIEVDRRMRTSRPHIFAAGDVIGRYQFTHAAGYEGGVALTNAILRLPRKADYTWMPWCTYTSPELASIGYNEQRARAAGLRYSLHVEQFADNDRANAEGATRGMVKLLLDAKGKPLGVQIVGPRAGDLLAEWVAVLNGRVNLSTLAGAVHPYPTLAEINKRVAGSVLSPKLFSETVRTALRLIFRYQGRAVP